METVVGRDGGIGEPGGEELLAVQADGYVLAYDLLGHYRDRRFSMGQEALTQRVVDAKFFRAVIGASVFLACARLYSLLVRRPSRFSRRRRGHHWLRGAHRQRARALREQRATAEAAQRRRAAAARAARHDDAAAAAAGRSSASVLAALRVLDDSGARAAHRRPDGHRQRALPLRIRRRFGHSAGTPLAPAPSALLAPLRSGPACGFQCAARCAGAAEPCAGRRRRGRRRGRCWRDVSATHPGGGRLGAQGPGARGALRGRRAAARLVARPVRPARARLARASAASRRAARLFPLVRVHYSR